MGGEQGEPCVTREEHIALLQRIMGGCCASVLDGVLFTCFMFGALSMQPRTVGGVRRAERIADDLLEQCNAETIRTWMKRLRAKGWIGQRLTVTAEGRRRLDGLLPRIAWHRRWSGKWYLVSFDIPERRRVQRNALRATLQRLRFGKLHASLWISPWDFLGDVQRDAHHHRLDDAVVLATSPRLGTREARALASRVWPVETINAQYEELVRAAARHPHDAAHMGAFLSILRCDPQLPQQLLPRPWYGFEAYRIASRVCGPQFRKMVQI